MESEEAIMENENNSNVESESINRERTSEGFQEASSNLGVYQSVSEAAELDIPRTGEDSLADNAIGSIATSGAFNTKESDDVILESSNLYSRNENPLKYNAQETTESDKTGINQDAGHVSENEVQESNADAEMYMGNFKEDINTGVVCDEPMEVVEEMEKEDFSIDRDRNSSNVCITEQLSAFSTTTTENSKVEDENVSMNSPNNTLSAKTADSENEKVETSAENMQEFQFKKKDNYFETEHTISSDEQNIKDNEIVESYVNENIDEPIAALDEANDDEDQTDSDSKSSTIQNHNERLDLSENKSGISQQNLSKTEGENSSNLNKEVLNEQTTIDMNSQNDVDQGPVCQNKNLRDDTIEEFKLEASANQAEESETVDAHEFNSFDSDKKVSESEYYNETEETPTPNTIDELDANTQRNLDQNVIAASNTGYIEPAMGEIEQNTLTETAEGAKESSDNCSMETDDRDLQEDRNFKIQHQFDNEEAKAGDEPIEVTEEFNNGIERDETDKSNEPTLESMETEEMALGVKKLSEADGEKMSLDEAPLERENNSAETIWKIEQTPVSNDECLTPGNQMSIEKLLDGSTEGDTSSTFNEDVLSEKEGSVLEATSGTDANKLGEVTVNEIIPQEIKNLEAADVLNSTSGSNDVHLNFTPKVDIAKDIEESVDQSESSFEGIIGAIKDGEEKTVNAAKSNEETINETALSFEESTSGTVNESESTVESAKVSEEDTNKSVPGCTEGNNESIKSIEKTMDESEGDIENTFEIEKVDEEGMDETKMNCEGTNEMDKSIETGTNETIYESESTMESAQAREEGTNELAKDSEEGVNETAGGTEESTNETPNDGEGTVQAGEVNDKSMIGTVKGSEQGTDELRDTIEKGMNETTNENENTVETAKSNEEGSKEIAMNNEDDSNEAVKGNEETQDLLDARNIKQELMSDEDFTTNATPDANILQMIKKEVDGSNNNDIGPEQEDIVILDDDGESFPVKKEPDAMVDSNLVISSVTGQENSIQEQTNLQNDLKTVEQIEKGGETKKSKPKTQTCIVCSKVCRCKYNIVRNGDVKHLCGDDCFKKFRKTPSAFLKNKEGKLVESLKSNLTAPSKPRMLQDSLTKFKTCTVCQLMNVNPSQPFCNWKGLDFCGETCLGKFQANLNTTCSFCGAFITSEMRATFCLKIGNDVRIFCKQRCVTEFRKNLRLCACCQKDLSSFPGAFSALVGCLDKKIRQFCSQACRQKLETQLVGVEVVSKAGVKAVNNSTAPQESPSPGTEKAQCAVCQQLQAVQHTVRFHGKVYHLCSNLCLSAFKYTNKIGLSKCDTCSTVCTVEEAQAHFVQFEGQVKRFCSDVCVNLFRRDNSKIMACCWCGTKKMNFDMIERLGADNRFQMFCTLNCLSLYRVNLQAKSNQAVACDQCKMVVPAQYHLTMSDASVRNFCSYTCVMTFQAQFTSKQLPPTQPVTTSTPSITKQAPPPVKQPPMPNLLKEPPDQQGAGSRSRIGTRNASKQNSPSFPVISNVVSLAPPSGGAQKESPSPATPDPSSQPASKSSGSNNNTLSSGDGKHQILIQAPPVKVLKNKSLQCRPVSLTKATSCRPHSQPKETQTEKIPDKQVFVPVPVPIYIPMPTVMYSAPTPVPVPFPLPIPVPVFIPTTRKSAAGIIKTISEIVERMPSDPLEAELLMMAEAVAADKVESDSESDAGNDFGAGFDDEPEEPTPPIQTETGTPPAKKKEGQGEEDMIQMALRMAEEMSAPVEDLESSVEPVAVNTEPPPSIHNTPTPAYQADEDYIPPGSRGRGRGVKRPRGRPSNARQKRQRVERNFTEQPEETPTQPVIPPQMIEPAADANYRLKFTYGVNAWRHWVIAKNAQIESTRKPNSGRVRTFPVDILKCTTDELNVSLIFFIKEVRKPNGEQYSPDSIYYLCLGIQQYLYENGRIDSIFTDNYFEKFADSLHEILKNLQPKVNAQGQMLCRIEEEHLWESKQLGAHSPFVLLNTLIYFHTKHFILKTAQEHMALSFAQILKHWKKGVPAKGQAASGKNISLRFYCLANGKKDNLAAKKNKEGVPVYEITENFDNPLRCPVKLYEFFLSKCPESIKNRNDIFYPVPERSCVPDSPVWYSTQSIGQHTMDKMLTRVLLVREIQESHLHAQPIYL